MRDIPGATDVQLRSPPGTPLLQIHLNLDQLNFWGVMPAQIVNTLQAAYETRIVGKQFSGQQNLQYCGGSSAGTKATT